MRPWSDDSDPATIPDAILVSERARRNALRRQTYTGGVYWKQHNPNTSRCRCVDCMRARHPEAKEQQRTEPVSATEPDAASRAKQREPKSATKVPPAAIELVPIDLGEHKTRQGLRAFVVRTDASLRYAYGFTEIVLRGQVYRTRRTWGLDTGKAILSRGRFSQSFDLVTRIDPRLTPRTAAKWPQEHSTLIQRWEEAGLV